MPQRRLPDLGLEPPWQSVLPGQHVDVLASTVVFDPLGQKHLLRSDIHKRFLVVSGILPRAQAYSLLGVEICNTQGGIRLDATCGHVLAHQVPDESVFYDTVEVCAGMGCLGFGLRASGMKVCAANDQQQTWCDFQAQQGCTKIHCGDLGSNDTLAALHGLHPSPALIAGGFSCQPWSQLGDQGKTMDSRSSALGYILRAAYFLRSHSVMMECVPGAGKDQEVQRMLEAFNLYTGFRMSQMEYKLDDLMPIKRHRWWCLMVNPAIPCPHLRAMPRLPEPPTFQDVIPVIPNWTDEDIATLALDQYETRMFEEYGGLQSSIIYPDTVVRTALHGWGNQLTGCPCGCRTHPLSHRRLSEKGIFGALIVLPGE